MPGVKCRKHPICGRAAVSFRGDGLNRHKMGQDMNVVWFKRDLRTHDHRALAFAAAQGDVL
ncbi:MAG: deoxyribodipyrimidine photo-lyase, partial [Pseudomonadota bacterium]